MIYADDVRKIESWLLQPTLAVICLGATAETRADSVVAQTNFRSPGTTLGTYTAGSDVGGPQSFNVYAGSAEVVGGDAGNLCVAAGGSCQCPRLNFSGLQLYPNTEFSEGRYRVDLELAGGNATDQVGVVMGMNYQFLTVVANTPFTNYTFFSTLPRNELSRVDLSGGGGVLPNSVTVTQFGPTQTPVPEPATLLLLGTGLAGIGARLRKKRSKLKSYQVTS